MTVRSLFLLVIFSCVGLFHSAFIPIFQISGNFEYAKVLLFMFLVSLFSLFFFLKKQFIFTPLFFLFVLFVFISTLFSASPFLSLVGGTEKGHGFLFFFCLFLFANICFQLSDQDKKYIEKGLFYLLIFVCLIALKERFLPSYQYGELSKRALGTFGSPNFLSGVILAFVPFFFHVWNEKKSIVFLSAGSIIFLTLFFTLQWLAIFLCVGYVLFFLLKKYSNTLKFWLFLIFFIVSGSILFFFPEKLHSFLARFGIWQTVINIIFSSPKIFVFGVGPEMLINVFTSYKVPSLYLYENFGFTADRAHNIFLDIWVQFGIVPFSILLYGIYRFFCHYKDHPYHHSMVLMIIFQFFNFPSVITFLLFIFFLSQIISKNTRVQFHSFFTGVLLFCICGGIIFISFFLYSSEIYALRGNNKKASHIFPRAVYFISDGRPVPWFLSDYKDEKYYQSRIERTSEKNENCHILTQKFPSVENHFFCGTVFENIKNRTMAVYYYQKGLQKLPDLRNENSPYWNDFFVSKTITGHRFFSQKFTPLKHILEFLGIPRQK